MQETSLFPRNRRVFAICSILADRVHEPSEVAYVATASSAMAISNVWRSPLYGPFLPPLQCRPRSRYGWVCWRKFLDNAFVDPLSVTEFDNSFRNWAL